jgi:small-conductance mechanosensitive channel
VNVRGDLFLALWDALKEAGIEIPYPHRDVAFRGPVKVELEQPSRPARRQARRKREAD